MNRAPATPLVGGVGLLAALACASGVDQRANVPPLERYTDRLIEASGAPAARGDCGMFGASRAGWCRVTGPGEAVPALVAGLPLTSGAPHTAFGDDTCLAFPPFGKPEGDTWSAEPGVTVYAPSAALPPNTDNVVLRRVYVAADRVEACLEFEYPYG